MPPPRPPAMAAPRSSPCPTNAPSQAPRQPHGCPRARGLKKARREARRHGGPQFLALSDERLLPGAAADQRLLHGAPAQAGENGLDGTPRARAVAAGADVERAGQALGALEQRVVGAV